MAVLACRRSLVPGAPVVAAALLVAAAPLGRAASPSADATRTPQAEHGAAPAANVLGADACVKCHAAEVEVWKRTPHYHTFEELHRRPAAKEIAERLGVRSIKYDDRCTACHYTQQADGDELLATSGVSCESCHGPAKPWLDVHHDYGGEGVSRRTETTAHRAARIAAATELGMRNPHNVYRIAQSCYRCHTVPDEELVNVGGHRAGSIDFEIVSWSQGSVRHNFVRSEGKENAPRSGAALRVLFAAGLVADLEFSLRAVAEATVRDTYGVSTAGRAARAAARLKSAWEKTEHPAFREALDVFSGVELRLNNRPALLEAADAIAAIGIRLGAGSGGSDLEALAPFIPAADRWK